MLSTEGFRILHGPVHHPYEHGKDILALSPDGLLTAFQLKSGDLDLAQFEEIQGQLLALSGTAVTYPGIEPPRIPDRAILVTSGTLTPPARSRLEAFNHSNRSRGLPALECIEKEQLVGRFREAHYQYFPSQPKDLNQFLTLFLSNGQDQFPIEEFMLFLDSLIAPAREGNSPLQVQRSLASAVLFTAYVSSPWERSANHVGVAEAWLTSALTIVRIASESNLPEQRWLTSYNLSFESGRNSLERLLIEAKEASDLVVPDLVDGLFYPTRALIVCGYLATFYLSESLHGDASKWTDSVREVLLRELPFIEVLGEAGVPFVFNLAVALELLDQPKEALGLVVRWANTLIHLNRVDSPDALPDPYHGLKEILSRSLEPEGWDEKFDGYAYTLHIAMDWLARRQLRPIVESMWPNLTRLMMCEFICSSPQNMLVLRDDNGQLNTWQPATPESWARLHEAACSLSETDLPMELWRQAELLPYLGLLLPFRFTSVVAKALEYLTTRRCRVTFDDGSNTDDYGVAPQC